MFRVSNVYSLASKVARGGMKSSEKERERANGRETNINCVCTTRVHTVRAVGQIKIKFVEEEESRFYDGRDFILCMCTYKLQKTMNAPTLVTNRNIFLIAKFHYRKLCIFLWARLESAIDKMEMEKE